jgi:hypothetical protein
VSNFKQQTLILEESHFSTGNGGVTIRIVETEWVSTIGRSSTPPEYTLETEMSHYGLRLRTSTPLIDPKSTEEIMAMLGRTVAHMQRRGVIANGNARISQNFVNGVPVVQVREHD